MNQLKLLGGSGNIFPTMVIKEPILKKIYSFEDLRGSPKLDRSSFERFLKLYFQKQLVAKVKSEPADAHSSHEHIVKVVGSTFDKLVLDSTKDVLIEFYAPWCEKCQHFEKVMQRLGEVFCDSKSLRIATMDATKNDVPTGVIAGMNGYPNIFLFPAGNHKKPIEYKGSKNAFDIVRFVQENSRFKIKLPNEVLAKLKTEKERSKKESEHNHSKGSHTEL